MVAKQHEVELQVGELTGYRVFRMKGHRLYGLSFSNAPLTPGANSAVCTAGHAQQTALRNNPETGEPELVPIVWHGPVPEPACGCGFWAYKEEAGALHRLKGYLGGGRYGSRGYSPYAMMGGGFGDFAEHEEMDQGVVFAEVKLWGRVVEGKDGYRAEHCRLSTLFVTRGVDEQDLAECAALYDVPVVESETLAKDPAVVEGYVIKDGLSKPKQGRSGRYAPCTVVLNTGDILYVWPRSKNQKGWSKEYLALKEAHEEERFRFRVRERYSSYNGVSQRFIESVASLAEPTSTDP